MCVNVVMMVVMLVKMLLINAVGSGDGYVRDIIGSVDVGID